MEDNSSDVRAKSCKGFSASSRFSRSSSIVWEPVPPSRESVCDGGVPCDGEDCWGDGIAPS